jgi:hypothetical protein
MSRTLTIEQVRQAAALKGVTCTSGRIVSMYTLLAFICPACSTPYKQRWLQFRKGNGQCASCNRLRGEANPSHKDLTPEERAAREPRARLQAHKVWEAAVFAAAHDRCAVTGRKGTKANPLVAHHLNAWATHPERRDDPTNGVATLRSIHRDFHAQYGNACTDAMWAEYINTYTLLQA